jgi:hypothetical protein
MGTGTSIDYSIAVGGQLRLVPSDHQRLAILEKDYSMMLEDGLLFDASVSLHEVIDRCRASSPGPMRAGAKDRSAESQDARDVRPTPTLIGSYSDSGSFELVPGAEMLYLFPPW